MKFRVEGDVQNVSRGGKTIDLSSGSYETDDRAEIAWLSRLPYMVPEDQAGAKKAQSKSRRKEELEPEPTPEEA